jgi:carbamoyltransferase
LLASGQVVATVRGEVEAGPRALGRRSILASPLVAEHRQTLNHLKGREAFRPFGVIIPREHMADFTDLDVDAPWMNLTVDVEHGQVPAAVHADGTVRVQTVTAQADPWLHALVTAFGDATGVYAVINTSLNTKGKAIFNRVGDALELLGHGVDALVVDDVLVT